MLRKLSLILVIFILNFGECLASTQARFGICTHPYRPREYNVRGQLLDAMKEMGVQYQRMDFPWGAVQKENGEFDFAMFDKFVDEFCNEKIKVLGILSSGGANGLNASKDIEKWKNYITTMVAHYKGKVDDWEVLNEYNAHGNGTDYGKYLKVAAEAIRAGNKDARVIYGGLMGAPADFVDESIKVAGVDSFDVMNFHVYPAPYDPEWRIKMYLDRLLGVMKKYGADKPVWITETGASTPPQGLVCEGIVQGAIKLLKLKNPKVFAIEDVMADACATARVFFPDVKKITPIKYEQIGELDANAVLVLPFSGHFPSANSEALVNFVRQGGTVIHPGGGYPFQVEKYDLENGKGLLGSKLLNAMHVSMTPSWGFEKDFPKEISGRSCSATQTLAKTNNLTRDLVGEELFRVQHFSDKKLASGDEFIPLAQTVINGKTINVASIYKLNSDLKGNLIFVSTKREWKSIVEYEQAAFIARELLFSMSCGIDKVFIYTLQSHQKVNHYEGNHGLLRYDFTRKPAFYAYKFCVELLGSAKPKYEKKGMHTMRWISSEGKNVFALWHSDLNVPHKVSIFVKSENFEIFDVCGNKITKPDSNKIENLTITSSPIYIVGDEVTEANLVK